MTAILSSLSNLWAGNTAPFLIHNGEPVFFAQLAAQPAFCELQVQPGEVVAVVGDFTPLCIMSLLRLIDQRAILVPLTGATSALHDSFFEAAGVESVLQNGVLTRRGPRRQHSLFDHLRQQQHAGLVLFTSGTTGTPKAIVHDLSLFLKRFETPRPTLRTISFLLFDHIGGLNTLFHTLYNKGTIIVPSARTPEAVLDACRSFKAQVLPATPTFLRMLLMSGDIAQSVPRTLEIITYGTERMDQPTLDALCQSLPHVDFRQTYGMSEIGIVRVKSKARNSLFMRIGGEGVETRLIDGELFIRSRFQMLGYLNSPQPFDEQGWYKTGDAAEEKDGWIRITGRTDEIINTGGLKFMPAEVEAVALQFPGIYLAKACARANPVTGQHVELVAQPVSGASPDKNALRAFLKERLLPHMLPGRISFGEVGIGHRFKKK